MDVYQFNIAGLSFRVSTQWHITLSPNFLPFIVPAGSLCQEQISMVCVEELPSTDGLTWVRGEMDDAETVIGGKKVVFHKLSVSSEPYLMEVYHSEHDREFRFLRRCNELPLSMRKVFGELRLEELFLRYDTLLLHSSFIRRNGAAILFSAPSGTGKSTQADLWARYMGAEILNGDRSALRKQNGVWTAFGLPFAGSSDIFRSESAPISHIVTLEQAPENRIVPLSPAQAFRKLLPEVSLHRWDPRFMDRGIDLLLDVLACVPVCHLACRPDRGAVELLHNTISHEV